MPIVDVDKLKRGGQQFASGFTAGQKAMSVLGVVALGLGLVMFTKWSATTDYAPVFTGLSSKDAGDISKALDGMKVPYKLTNGGNTIEVPQSAVYKTRVDLSSKGLPTSNDGYALLDKNSITTNGKQQDINLQRAIQTELGNTIASIRGVNHASVTLALPSDSPFVDDRASKTTASVQIDTGSLQMQTEQVQAIVHLVASAVKNLSPSGITITDTNGILLYSAGQSGAMSSAENLSKKMQYENNVKAKIERFIASTLGPGHATVTGQIEMDFGSGTTVKDTQSPVLDPSGKPSVGSRTTKTENLNEVTPPGQGVVAAPTPGAASPNATKVFKTDEETINGVFDRQHTESQKDTDAVKSQSWAIALDNSVVKDADLPKWKTWISNAVGIQTGRNDRIDVGTTAIDKNVQKAAQDSFNAGTKTTTPATPLDIMGIARYALTFLIVAIVLFIAWRSVKKAQAAMDPERVSLDLVALEQQQLNLSNAALELTALGAGGSGELPAGSPRQIESSRSMIELEVAELIERQPEEVAQTLRTWLADRRS